MLNVWPFITTLVISHAQPVRTLSAKPQANNWFGAVGNQFFTPDKVFMKKFPIHSAAGISLWLFTVNIVLVIASYLLENTWLATAAITMSSMMFYLQIRLSKSMSSPQQEHLQERKEAGQHFRV